MNNNRNNNRRRGRGNNRNQGGANSGNRIDSRARGNAPQLLDKYKKLAQDAQHNGDRVQAEYYLQFADHYFRVIADNKARQEEAKAKRQDDRGGNSSDDDDETFTRTDPYPLRNASLSDFRSNTFMNFRPASFRPRSAAQTPSHPKGSSKAAISRTLPGL